MRWQTVSNTLMVLLMITLAAAANLLAAGPRPGAVPLDEQGRMHMGAGDRCPVCAMQVRAHAKFASAIRLDDGTTYYFCGTGCMIRTWLHPEIFIATAPARLERPVVRDYFTGRPFDARQAFWVAGSDIVGPMGPALVPLMNESDLAVFRKRHGGKVTFRLDEMNDQKWQQITGKKAVR